MKKAIAGVFAGAVAISAVATTMASAKTVSYPEVEKKFEFTKSGYVIGETKDDESYTWNIASEPSAATTSGDALVLTFDKAVNDVRISFVSTSPAFDSGDIEMVKGDADGYKWVLVNRTLPTTITSVKVKYDVNSLSDKVYKYQSDAKEAADALNNVATNTITITPSTSATTTVYGSLTATSALPIVNDFSYSKKDDAVVLGEFNEGEKEWIFDNVGDAVSNPEKAKIDGNFYTDFVEDQIDALSETVAGRTKGTFTFQFDGIDDWDNYDEDLDVTATIYFDIDGYSTVYTTVDVDMAKQTATVDWAKLVSKINYVNAFDISDKIDNIGFKLSSKDDYIDGDTYTLSSITFKADAESYTSLSAGESVADTTAAITSATEATTAAATEDTTTAAASNPKTGNAPVALAVIPVAIAAAAIIAKKRG
jgi:hypothetical protein